MRIPQIQSAAALLTSLASTVSALATFSPGPSYSVGIPSSSTISSSSTGPLYFQLSAPTSYQWVGLGIGSQMAGATIFVMYADGNGNVTISARDGGQGHSEPTADSGIQAGVTLLAGSGIVGGQMIANVKCTTCKLDSSSSSSSSPWIAAWNQGSAINSASLSYTISQHGGSDYRQVNLDLTKASMSSDSNPFVTSSSTSPSSAAGSGSGTATATAHSPSSTSGSDSSSSEDNGSGNSGNSGVVEVGTSFQVFSDYDKAHGIIMGVTFVLLFPLGATFMRLGSSAWMHGAWQLFSLAVMLCGLGVGVKLAQMRSYLFNNTHTIFGIVIIALFLIQPIFGIIHHIQYERNQTRAPVSHIHIWYGRILMILGVVNGGLGLNLAANTHGGEIAYGVVAGLVGVVYILAAALKRKGGAVPLVLRKEGGVENGDGVANGYGRRLR